ncbi:MAG: glycerol-3-phosphate 1-O-acyltransferase PlsY [Firmicutes bacterium]|nr:glycerol-3-phosphate 1-O-acyltransferase PlsY [Bacillota bacterium]
MVGIIGGADGPTAVYLDINIGLLALAIVIAYFIGCISPSIMLAKARGIDIKKEGSGNAGTTNALRVMGKKAGVITLVVDILKGVIAVVLGNLIAGTVIGGMCAAVTVFCGHVWPALYKFKGGKGVATAFGALLGIDVVMALICLLIVVIAVVVSKRMSVGSILGAACFPLVAYFTHPAFIIPGSALALCIIIKHKANIVRLIHGEEPIMSIFDKSKEK